MATMAVHRKAPCRRIGSRSVKVEAMLGLMLSLKGNVLLASSRLKYKISHEEEKKERSTLVG